MKMHMTAVWELISSAEYIDEHYPDKQAPDSVLCELYKGALVPAILSGAIEPAQNGALLSSRLRKQITAIFTLIKLLGQPMKS